ncbi:MAG: flagellar filament capping protein FliD [Xanthomonadaceae bacterium]|nr:flagellar filament capping protein FliD [Xanthomonadaceae bacterium]MBS3959485.1 flagellar filament capping protein FliD [Xanthomonadaceae bacterium]
MGSLSSPGIGSGLNVNQLVSQLVAAERAPAERRIARQEADVRADLTAFGQIRASLTALQAAANALDGAAGLPGRRATVAEGAGFTATATAEAALGRYEIEVAALATAERRQSAAVAETADLGTGTLTFTVGADSFNVVLGPTTTVNQLRDAINAATGGRGLSATVVRGDAGSVLVLNAASTGTAGAIGIAASGTISTFANGLAVTTAAADALVRVDGIARTASSNRIDDLIAGVTLDLRQAQPASRFALDITADNAPVLAAMQGFVSAYNTALGALRTASAFNPETRSGGPLLGDAAVRGLQQSLRGVLGQAFGDLAALGLRSSKDGSLSLDAGRLEAALVADPRAVERVFDKARADSLGAALAGRLDGAIGPGSGLLEARTNALNERLRNLQADRQRLDVRIGRVEDGLRRQFTALDGLVAQLQTTQNFLTRELARLPGASTRP